MSFGHAVIRIVLSITRVFEDIIGADEASPLKGRLEHGRIAWHGKFIEALPRHAGEGIEHVALALIVEDVVEESAELGVHDLSAGVSGNLHDLVYIKLGGQRSAHAVKYVELARFSPDRKLRCVLLGDVVALHEDAGGSAVIRHDRLINEIEIALDEGAVRTLLQVDGRATSDIGLAGSIDPIEQPDEALLDHLPKRLGHGPTHHIATGDERPIGLVHHGETMLGSARHRGEAGRLLEHALKALAFGFKLALDPHLVRDLDDDRHDSGE